MEWRRSREGVFGFGEGVTLGEAPGEAEEERESRRWEGARERRGGRALTTMRLMNECASACHM